VRPTKQVVTWSLGSGCRHGSGRQLKPDFKGLAETEELESEERVWEGGG
jgi:hypothetical protein